MPKIQFNMMRCNGYQLLLASCFALAFSWAPLALSENDTSDYPDDAVIVTSPSELDSATSMRSSFIVAKGEIAQQIIGALDARPGTKGNLVSLALGGIPGVGAYQLYAWFNEEHENIESVCEVDLDEVYFTERGDKYVCEDYSLRFPK
mgnify:CR=1 FL=1